MLMFLVLGWFGCLRAGLYCLLLIVDLLDKVVDLCIYRFDCFGFVWSLSFDLGYLLLLCGCFTDCGLRPVDWFNCIGHCLWCLCL